MKNEREKPEEEGSILKLIRIASMLIDRFVEDEKQRKDFFELVDKATEEIKIFKG